MSQSSMGIVEAVSELRVIVYKDLGGRRQGHTVPVLFSGQISFLPTATHAKSSMLLLLLPHREYMMEMTM